MNSVIGAYIRTTKVQIAALLYFILSVLLTQIPLFNYLGYEFSAVMTIPAAFISGIMTLLFLNEHRQKPLTRRTWLFVVIDYIHINFLLLLIPLIVISLNAFAVKNCAYSKGLAFFLTMPIITMVFSVSLALVVGTMFRHSIAVFSAVVLAILAHIPAITYFYPQLFAYNLILGFFPGITYDETVGDIQKLLLFREWTVIISLLMMISFFIIHPHWKNARSLKENIRAVRSGTGKDRALWIVFWICAAVVTLGWIEREDLGFEYSSPKIQNELGRRSESEHFIFYYAADDYPIKKIIQLRALAESDYEFVCSRLEIVEPKRTKIEVFLYPSASEKQRYIGTSNTNIAKPWMRQIHLTAGSFESTFRHELVHVLAGNFGFPVIHASIRMGLNEGLAVATDWDEGLCTPHQYAAALLRDRSLHHPAGLFSLSGFASQSSSYAYLVSGSFCRYLIDRFGMSRFKFAFSNGNFVLAFGESVDDLTGEWMAFLKTVDTSELPPETITALFSQSSIFYKTCPREVAEKNRYAVSAIRAKNYPLAEQQFEASYGDAPTVFALRGIFQSLLLQQKYREVISRFTALPERAEFRVNPALILAAADAYMLTNDDTKASALYRSIVRMNYSEGFSEAASVRDELLTAGIPTAGFRKLFYSDVKDSAARAVIETLAVHATLLPIQTYLLASIETRLGNDSAAISLYRRYGRTSASGIMSYFAWKHIGDLAFRSGDFETAKSAYWSAKNFALTSAAASSLDERIDLCETIVLHLQ